MARRRVRPQPTRPGPADADPIQLADVAPPEAAQERPQGGWRLDYAAQGLGGSPGAQHVGVVNAVAGQRRRHQGQHLVTRIRPPRRIAQVQVMVNQFTQTQVLGQRDRKEQPSIGHQAAVVEGDLDAVRGQVVASVGCSLFRVGFVIPKPLSRSTYFLTPSARRDTHIFGGLGISYGLRDNPQAGSPRK